MREQSEPRAGPFRALRILSRVWRALAVVAVVVALWLIVVPQFAEAGRAWGRIGPISIPLLALGLLLELGSLASYGALTRAALDPAARPSFWTVIRIDLVGVGVTNSLPGGAATALAVRFHLLGRAGTPYAAAAGSLAVEAAISNLLLGGMFACGLVLSVAVLPPNPFYPLAIVVVAVLAIIAVALVLAARHPERASGMVAAAVRRLPSRFGDRVTGFVGTAIVTVAAFGRDRRRLGAAVLWGTVNWALDAASLWVLLMAFGYRGTAVELLLAYTLAGVVALVPITPGGIGVVEGVLVPLIASFGSPHAIAVLGVTAWRLVQYWMPIPLGGLAALSLLVGRGAGRPSRRVSPSTTTAGTPAGRPPS